ARGEREQAESGDGEPVNVHDGGGIHDGMGAEGRGAHRLTIASRHARFKSGSGTGPGYPTGAAPRAPGAGLRASSRAVIGPAGGPGSSERMTSRAGNAAASSPDSSR